LKVEEYKKTAFVCQLLFLQCPANLEMSYFYQNRNVLLKQKTELCRAFS
jgi:hypothetical protein